MAQKSHPRFTVSNQNHNKIKPRIPPRQHRTTFPPDVKHRGSINNLFSYFITLWPFSERNNDINASKAKHPKKKKKNKQKPPQTIQDTQLTMQVTQELKALSLRYHAPAFWINPPVSISTNPLQCSLICNILMSRAHLQQQAAPAPLKCRARTASPRTPRRDTRHLAPAPSAPAPFTIKTPPTLSAPHGLAETPPNQ